MLIVNKVNIYLKVSSINYYLNSLFKVLELIVTADRNARRSDGSN